MLWSLLDSRAYTAGELALAADIAATAASNHLSKLLDAGILKVERQGRHRYYSFSKPEVAYVIESLANLASDKTKKQLDVKDPANGVKFCRTCYDHIAGYVGVQITEALEKSQFVTKTKQAYEVTDTGWEWFADLGIEKNNFTNSRRPLTRLCLDWSERKPHLAGHLGAALLDSMLRNRWLKKLKFSRELLVTSKGREAFSNLLGITLP